MPAPILARARFAFAVAAAIVPAAMVGVGLIGYDYYERERERLVRDSTATARALTAAVDAELHGVRSALFALATSPHLAGGDLGAFHAQASASLKDQGFSNIVLIGEDSRQKLNTLRPFGQPLPGDTNPQLKRILTVGEAVVTDLFRGPVAGKPLVAVGVPVRREGVVRYSLNAGIFPERLGNILSAQRLPEGWIAGVFDTTGTVVARTHGAERFVGKKAVPELVQAMRAAAEGSLQTESLEGTRVLTVFSRSPVSGWTVAIGIPREDLTRHLWSSLARLGIVAFVMLATALVAAILIGRRIGD